MKCKVFNSSKTLLEEDVNNWLKTGNYEIVSVTQTHESPSYITLTIFYLDVKEVRFKKLEKLNSYRIL
jgi:hypothetical protein